MPRTKKSTPVIGWREWVALPALGIPAIKVKADTGARTSALHAFNLTTIEGEGVVMVRFDVHPFQRSARDTVTVEAPLLDERYVRNSGGQLELRQVIRTSVALQGRQWQIDLTLTNRDAMGFRMLLGREALRGKFLVDPSRSYLDETHKPAHIRRTRWKESS